MNKSQLVYIIGVGFVGAIGLATTWYAGRKSYKQGVKDGCELTNSLYELFDKVEKSVSKKTES